MAAISGLDAAVGFEWTPFSYGVADALLALLDQMRVEWREAGEFRRMRL